MLITFLHVVINLNKVRFLVFLGFTLMFADVHGFVSIETDSRNFDNPLMIFERYPHVCVSTHKSITIYPDCVSF